MKFKNRNGLFLLNIFEISKVIFELKFFFHILDLKKKKTD